jgi:LCP family protein required for cell wall assembly
LVTAIYFFAPGRYNILLLGIDRTAAKSYVGRTDTMILTTVAPTEPYVGLVSIPRDLWVNIPGIGENRINTAHFFAEAAQAGSGPAAAMQTVRENLGERVDYYVRVKFEGFRDIVNALGGVDIVLTSPTAGYEPGSYHLTGEKALAFARNRTGTDDFYRMQQGQLILKAVLNKIRSPLNWYRLPAVAVALMRSIDWNIPFWLWPRIGLTLLRVGTAGIDSQAITRDMVTPTTTDQGASVLLPNWDKINPVLAKVFGQ